MRTNEIDDENSLADWTFPQDEEKSSRQLTSDDVQQALFTLALSTNISDQGEWLLISYESLSDEGRDFNRWSSSLWRSEGIWLSSRIRFSFSLNSFTLRWSETSDSTLNKRSILQKHRQWSSMPVVVSFDWIVPIVCHYHWLVAVDPISPVIPRVCSVRIAWQSKSNSRWISYEIDWLCQMLDEKSNSPWSTIVTISHWQRLQRISRLKC